MAINLQTFYDNIKITFQIITVFVQHYWFLKIFLLHILVITCYYYISLYLFCEGI